jgi:hypothetical protein
MIDKDKEAFEEFYGSPRVDSDGDFKDSRDIAAWELWKAARDHYGPKVTEKDAVQVVADRLWPDKAPMPDRRLKRC